MHSAALCRLSAIPWKPLAVGHVTGGRWLTAREVNLPECFGALTDVIGILKASTFPRPRPTGHGCREIGEAQDV